MKKIKKLLFTIVVALVCGICTASGCVDKTTKYTFSFETNGGPTVSAVSIEKGKSYTLPVPQRDGYRFDGWFTAADFSGEPVTEITEASANQTYYAKWSQVYAVTLDTDGGSLSETTVYLAEGESLYTALQSYAPQKGELSFGGWFKGDAPISAASRMPAEAITVTAKYKVGYTVETWVQNETLDGYVKGEEVNGEEFVGVSFTASETLTGFKAVSNAGEILTKTLSATKTENVFKQYFNRETYTITLRANYPDGRDEERTLGGVYGIEQELPYDYEQEGYWMVGWATNAIGSVEYPVNSINDLLYNKEEGDGNSASKYSPTKSVTLYAVWSKAYVDLFGGSDEIYLLDEKADTIYLRRGNVFFKGNYRPDKKTFEFLLENDDLLLDGKLNDGRIFVYYNADRESSADLYTMAGIDENVTVYFDEYDGMIYSAKNEHGVTSESEGTYTINENGEYVVFFHSGDLSQQTLYMKFGVTTNDKGAQIPVFQVRNEEEYALGTIVRFAYSGTDLMHYPSAYQIAVDGYGVASYNTGNGTTTYFYEYDKETSNLSLLDNSRNVVQIVRVLTFSANGERIVGYMLYDAALDTSYEIGTEAITMDGVSDMTYKTADGTISGVYTTAQSQLGGTLITMTALKDGKVYKFLITKTVTPPAEVGGEEIVTYSASHIQGAYAEYYYTDESNTYISPLLVINDTAEGRATLYGCDSNRAPVKVSQGNYVYDEATGNYQYTATEFFTADNVLTSPVDPRAIKSFVYAVDTTSGAYSVFYWFTTVNQENESEEYGVKYKTADGTETMHLIAGFVYYTNANGEVVTGRYSESNNLVTLLIANKYLYVEIDKTEKTFEKLHFAPYTAYLIGFDGAANQYVTLDVDGKGSSADGFTAVYTEHAETADGADVVYAGKFKTVTTNAFSQEVLRFTSDDGTKTFDFIMLSSSSNRFFSLKNEAYATEYAVTGGGLFEIDGYGFSAFYQDANGVVYEGRYVIGDNDVINFTAEDGTSFVFDVKAEAEVSVRGAEEGTYLYINNSALNGWYVELSGYGSFVIYTAEKNEEDETVKTTVYEGNYTINDEEITLVAQDETIVGKTGTIAYNGVYYRTFVAVNTAIKNEYVNKKDWSVLILDNDGSAVLHDTAGVVREGSYVVVTDDLLYFVYGQTEEYAALFRYDTQNATIDQVKLTPRGYYTENLESLLFSKAGFAIFNGTDRYYYEIVNNEVVIYEQNPESEDANAYGFVAKKFGEFEDSVVWEGKTYYANNGYAIDFKRDEATKTEYPVLANGESINFESLIFTPSGTEEFSVGGYATVGNNRYECTVVREKNEDGSMVAYVWVGSMRFTVDLFYRAENSDGTSNSSFKVTALNAITNLDSYNFSYMYLLYYIYFGSSYANALENTYGSISVVYEYNKEGDLDRKYINGTFGADSKMYDLNENIVSITEQPFTQYESGLFEVKFTAEDGYDYVFYFGVQSNEYFAGYVVYAFVRVETLTYGEYTVNVERIVASDSGYTAGSYFQVALSQKAEGAEEATELSADIILTMGASGLRFIVNTYDETDTDKVVASTYYWITFTTKDDGVAGESKIFPAFESVKVEKEEMEVKYTADGKYVQISATTGVVMIVDGDELYAIDTCEYNESTKTYRVTAYKIGVGEAIVYDITVDGDTVTITQVQESEPQA